MSINNDNPSSLAPRQISSASSSTVTPATKKRKEESQAEVTVEQSQITSSSQLENTSMNLLQQEIFSRDVEEQLKEKEGKQQEEPSKRLKETSTEEVGGPSFSPVPLSSEELLPMPSPSIIFLGNAISSAIPLSLSDPRLLEYPVSSSSLLSSLVANESSSISISGVDSSSSTNSFEILQSKAASKLSATMTLQDITDTYNAFFKGEIRTKAFSEEVLSQDNPSSPSLPYVFKRLHDCLAPLQGYGTFAKVLEARETAIQANQLDSFPVVTPLDLNPNAKNINQVYFLRDQNNKIGWVFKPEFELQEDGEGQKIKMRIGEPDISQREHTASLVNFHHQFPIPLTVKIDVMGYEGSAQLFVEGAIEADNLPNESHLNVKSLHSLLIFDLLFSNQDRHMENVLFRKQGEEYVPYGIDHDSCMCYGERLKIQYLEIDNAFDFPLESELESLVTSDNIRKYVEIMRKNDRPLTSIKWMEMVGRTLKIYYLIEDERPTAKKLFAFLRQLFEQINIEELDYFDIDESYISEQLTS